MSVSDSRGMSARFGAYALAVRSCLLKPDIAPDGAGDRSAMPSEMVIVKYPTGGTEFRMLAEAPRVGDKLQRGNDDWNVIDVRRDENDVFLVTLGSLEGLASDLGASAAGIPGHP
jgi:hypothetical protein